MNHFKIFFPSLFILCFLTSIVQSQSINYPYYQPTSVQSEIISSNDQPTLFLNGLDLDSNPHLVIGKNGFNEIGLGVIGTNSFNPEIPVNSGFMNIPLDFSIYNFYKDGESDVMNFGSYAGYGQVNVNGNFSSGPININKASGGAAIFNEEGEIKYENGDFQGYTSSGWQSFTGGSSLWQSNGNKTYYNQGFVGVGTNNPNVDLQVKSNTGTGNIVIESSNGTSIRMFSSNGSAGLSTISNIPLSLAAGNIEAMKLFTNQNASFYGDINLLGDKSLNLGNASMIADQNGFLDVTSEGYRLDSGTSEIELKSGFNNLSLDQNSMSLNTFDGGIFMESSFGPISIRAREESNLYLHGSLDAILDGYFGAYLKSQYYISFDIEDQPSSAINDEGNWGIKNTNPVGDFHISQEAIGGNHTEGLVIENDGSGNDYWNIAIGANDLTFYFDEDGPGTTNSFLSKARINDVDGAWTQISDRRLKKDIKSVGEVLPKVLQLNPSRYKYKSSHNNDQESIGFIAQEVQQLFPELVNDEEDYLMLSYAEMNAISIKAIQEQQIIIQKLLETQNKLEQEISKLKITLNE